MKEQFKRLQREFFCDSHCIFVIFLLQFECLILILFGPPDVDNVLQRMTIVGVILSFHQLAQAALVDVLEERVPFLLSSVLDFRQHAPPGDTGNLADQLVRYREK